MRAHFLSRRPPRSRLTGLARVAFAGALLLGSLAGAIPASAAATPADGRVIATGRLGEGAATLSLYLRGDDRRARGVVRLSDRATGLRARALSIDRLTRDAEGVTIEGRARLGATQDESMRLVLAGASGGQTRVTLALGEGPSAYRIAGLLTGGVVRIGESAKDRQRTQMLADSAFDDLMLTIARPAPPPSAGPTNGATAPGPNALESLTTTAAGAFAGAALLLGGQAERSRAVIDRFGASSSVQAPPPAPDDSGASGGPANAILRDAALEGLRAVTGALDRSAPATTTRHTTPVQRPSSSEPAPEAPRPSPAIPVPAAAAPTPAPPRATDGTPHVVEGVVAAAVGRAAGQVVGAAMAIAPPEVVQRAGEAALAAPPGVLHLSPIGADADVHRDASTAVEVVGADLLGDVAIAARSMVPNEIALPLAEIITPLTPSRLRAGAESEPASGLAAASAARVAAPTLVASMRESALALRDRVAASARSAGWSPAPLVGYVRGLRDAAFPPRMEAGGPAGPPSALGTAAAAAAIEAALPGIERAVDRAVREGEAGQIGSGRLTEPSPRAPVVMERLPDVPDPATLPARTIDRGAFYPQTGDGYGSGFAVTDDEGIPMFTAYQRAGGVAVLGYPVSGRFLWDGFVVQVFQRGIAQWRPEVGQVYFVNIFDRLHDAGLDSWLRRAWQIPRQMVFDDPAGADEVARARLALLDASPALREAYFRSGPDPIAVNGLPTSELVDMGNHLALRCQRVVFQIWKVDVPWARAGEVTIALGGDIAKEAGLLPGTAALRPTLHP